MTTEQENKIIEQAQDIMARRFAVGNDLKLNQQIVAYSLHSSLRQSR